MYYIAYLLFEYKKSKAIPVAGHGGPQNCETSRLPHFLENWFIDGGEVVGLTWQLPFTPSKISGTHFCWRVSQPHGHSAARRHRSTKKSNEFIGN
jgi:hypothetical protein